MAKRRPKKSLHSLSVRTIGTGEIEYVSSADSNSIMDKSNAISSYVGENDHNSFFVVRNFQVVTSKWLHYKDPSLSSSTETTAAETREAPVTKYDTPSGCTKGNNSSSQGKGGVVRPSTTDLAYRDSSEREGAELIRQALTFEELNAMPDEFMPLRHYRAEKGDVDIAIDTIKRTLQWRKEFEVDKIVSALEDDAKKTNGKTNENDGEDFAAIIRKETETGKIYVRGYDKDGRALMYMRPGRENTMHEDNNMRNLVFQIEKTVACSQKNGHGKICLVIDYDGFSLANAPSMSSSKRTLEILQRHFCERMYRCYINNPPFIFRTFYSVIKPFVDPVTKQKVCWLVGKKGMEQIVNDLGGPEKASVQLEKALGGSDRNRDFDSVEYNLLPMAVAFDEKVDY